VNVQVLRFEDMTEAEREELIDTALVPTLATFVIAAATVGLPATVAACHARVLPPSVVVKLEGTGLDASRLPSGDDATRFLMGLRLYVRHRGETVVRYERRRKIREERPGTPIATLAVELGLTVDDAMACLRTFYHLSGKDPE
jgi:hypothetical protein